MGRVGILLCCGVVRTVYCLVEFWSARCVSLFQIKNKPLQLPMFEPDSSEPIFGKDEGELMVEKQKQEQNYMKHQLEAAASHRRRTILQQLVEQKRDLQMLRRTQRE